MKGDALGTGTVSERLRLLEAKDEIANLKARYAAACDDGYNPEVIASLFIPDGTWDGGRYGRFSGRDQIRQFFESAGSVYSFAVHWVANPHIEVSGRTGIGSWYLLMAATRASDGVAIWNAARYTDELVEDDGVWLFASMTVRHWFTTPFDQGWARERFPGE
jgi:hypothetical protein